MFQKLNKDKEIEIYETLHNNGIMEIKRGLFSRCYKIDNIDFLLADLEEQMSIIKRYIDLLTGLAPDVCIQINIYNRKTNKEKKNKEIYMKMKLDDLNSYRKEYNNWIKEHIDKKKQVQREIYLILTIKEESVEKVLCRYYKIYSIVASLVNRITSYNMEPLKKEEWEELLLEICGKSIIKKQQPNKSKETSFVTVSNSGQIGNKYVRHFVFKGLTDNCNYNLINEIMEIDAVRMISLHFKSTNEYQKKLLIKKANYTSTEYLAFDRVLCNSVVTLFAENELDLKNQISNLKSEHLKQVNKVIITTILPIGTNKIKSKELISINEAGKLIPFSYKNSIQEKNGFCYGIHPLIDTPIIYDRRKHKNGNGIILGNAGSGKTEIMKNEIKQVLLQTEDDVTILDPWNEYSEIAKTFHGDIICLEPDSDWHINPLDLHVDNSGFTDPLALQCDFITGLYETTLDTNYRLSTYEKSIIDRCVWILYKPYLKHMEELHRKDPTITCDVAASPTLKDFREILFNQPEAEAKLIALTLEKLHVFDYKTNVLHKNRLTIYQCSYLWSDLEECVMLIYLNAYWNHILANNHISKYKWFYIDEIHPFMKSDSAISYLSQIYKRGRSQWCIPTCATACTDELLKSPITESILNNCDTIMLLNQSKETRKLFSDLLNIPLSLERYITNVGPWQGLLYTGRSITPFKQERIININKELT
ncbi:VirB4-like conjugal transfer ATPase, CD1110 family [Lacrimispora amygdalina]|uniref:VirB4-like conjugal transfer ATPase, CD1110 family n=1 Tax=Lacrimispora amygdalina TaxID=253257 RepID=UPI000BE30512|nr:hypothetical protein [Lacrimispora amygdalina]